MEQAIQHGPHTTPTTRHRFHFLDGMRGLAAAVVVLFHTPLNRVDYPFVPNGFLAVDFFLCLSGFIVAFSYEQRLQHSMAFREFVVARLVRLSPVYLLGWLLGVLVFFRELGPLTTLMLKIKAAGALLLSLFILPAGFITVSFPRTPPFYRFTELFPFDRPAWTLFFELLVNFAFAWLAIRGFAKGRVLLALSLASFAASVWWVSKLHSLSDGWGATRNQFGMGFVRITMSFCLGILVLRLWRKRTHPRRIGKALPLLLASLLLVTLVSPFHVMQHGAFQLIAEVFIFPLIVFAGANVDVPSSWVRVCSFLGEASYPAYILHDVLLHPLYHSRVAALLERTVVMESVTSACWLVAIFAMAYFVAIKIDMPARKKIMQILRAHTIHPTHQMSEKIGGTL